ncbi:mediator of RNA polymerase II transcription subunit 13 isoform X2 [Impatiens glandulifera]|uniref:mediator of RNA polymerase II transcription subunit 13 isoform X2 n=1 Tax=Impatiens glandulifera TaxID=253017 RepID=UPI001FB07F3E|nr:mediator of RNA polymerase II transcription subunit 13 isoform X2 [Impatiens glandulifera]
MWTNVFKIGGLNQISWFQFLPNESDLNSLPDKSGKGEQNDAATLLVLSAHFQLQKEGFISTWTNSFVGPWDPSQGQHNPDEKIKLWLFLPGRYSSPLESAQTAVSCLRVIASGLWLAPGDSEEVAVALSQALRNRLERALSGLSYVRFGDVFSKYRPFSHSEELFRKGQHVVEFIFAATEDAIYVHVLISARHIRALSSGDVERILGHLLNHSNQNLPVIVSPHGMRGKLTGCCPSDLVKQVYPSSGKMKSSNGIVGLPNYRCQFYNCQLRGQNCYLEVTLGCPRTRNEKAVQSNVNLKKLHHIKESSAVSKVVDNGLSNHLLISGSTFIYPPEAVLVPVLQMSSARSSLKRFWLQNWVGPSLSGLYFFINSAGEVDFSDGSFSKPNGPFSNHDYHSSSNSNNSSISSICSTSSDSDYNMTAGGDDLEADADSLTCGRSGVSSDDQLQRDGLKLQGLKRGRAGMNESFGQAGTVKDVPVQCEVASNWDWDDDRGAVMDIQVLLSEFGDFRDFFENDSLPFGEPPGTAESQALMFSIPDGGDVGSSPCTGIMDDSDQIILPVGFQSLDNFTAPPLMEEHSNKNQEVVKVSVSLEQVNDLPASFNIEFANLLKAEAQISFAPEYGAVEANTSEASTSIFKSPYVPKSRQVDGADSCPKSYVYKATPPQYSSLEGSDEKSDISTNLKGYTGRSGVSAVATSRKYYTLVGSGKEKNEGKNIPCHKSSIIKDEEMVLSSYPDFDSGPVKPFQTNVIDTVMHAEKNVISTKTKLATEIECIMFQASMCRMRHTLLSSGNSLPVGLSGLTGSSLLSQLHSEPSCATDNISNKYEVKKKKETIPMRIAGDFNGGIQDGPINAPVGVWRQVGVSKGSKPTPSPSLEASHSLPHLSSEEGVLSYGQRQPLLEFLDGLALFVQQATSFVDIALDADFGDGPYGWLAVQEQWRRGFACGPSMVHAGCGGSFASCHSLDIAGVELVDPLLADVHASSVIGLLQSDIKTALRSAFGTSDGPLLVNDWCKGRNQSVDAGSAFDVFSTEVTGVEGSNMGSSTVGETLSPSQSSVKDGASFVQRRPNQEICTSDPEQQLGPKIRPSLFVLPLPSILVGYQDDWLKTSASSLQLWDKAPLEPYASPKPMSYFVVCPDIDPLINAASDFFQQLGTVYETCKLGTHLPQSSGTQMEMDSGKRLPTGFVLLDCPQSMKIESSAASLVGSISDYFLSLSNGWDLQSYLKSLSKVLKALKLGLCTTTNPKEENSRPCLVIYVVCPFPEPAAILQTVIESSISVGSNILSADKERRSIVHNQVMKALSCSATVDEASTSNILTLSGFNIPKLVLQIVTVDAIFRVTNPAVSELIILKETAFTVYNKARRVSRGNSTDANHSVPMSGRSSVMMQVSSPIQGMWKECVGPRITGPLQREGELDASLRPGTWDNSWQAARMGGISYDPSRNGDFLAPEESRYMFEPFFILSESGSLDHGISPSAFNSLTSEPSKSSPDDYSSGNFVPGSGSSGNVDNALGSQVDRSDADGYQKSLPSLHCCYGWTEDWRWLVCIWTDSRGELLDSYIFPFGGISSRQDTKGLQSLFVQMLHQGCQILQACSSSDIGVAKPRDFVISRIGSFFELECQEWQKALYSVGGSEVKKWPLQLRRPVPDGILANSNGPSLQEQEMSLMQERNLPSSPSPLYSSHSKSSGFMKGGLSQSATRKQLMSGHHPIADHSRGLLQYVQSISFVSVSLDHTLNLVLQADLASPGSTQGSSTVNGYLEGFTPVKSLGTTSASYLMIPSPSMRFLPPTPLQLPTCLTAESPPLGHLLHSKGSAIPLCTGFVVSKAVPSMRKDSRSNCKEEWPSVLSVSLVDYYGGNNIINQEKMMKGGGGGGAVKQQQGARGAAVNLESRDFEVETHLILEGLAAELNSLSWMTISPAYLDRRTALPFHCDMVLRLRRLLHFADKELNRQPDK